MNSIKNTIWLVVFCALWSGCTVDDLLLSGDGPVTYSFINDSIKDSELHINESLVTIFELESDDNGDKAKIWAVYIGEIASISTDTVIVYCHGNSESLNDYVENLAALANIGHQHRYGVLAIEYRGFGNSEGKTTANTFVADIDAALKWLKSNGLSNNRCVIMGYSLGGTAAVLGAVNAISLTSTKLILEAPFPGVSTVLQGTTGLSVPGSFISDLGTMDSAEEIKSFTGDLLWLHCQDDETVPIEHARPVYDAHSGNKNEIHPLTGGHSVIEGMGSANYLKELEGFITE